MAASIGTGPRRSCGASRRVFLSEEMTFPELLDMSFTCLYDVSQHVIRTSDYLSQVDQIDFGRLETNTKISSPWD